MAALASVLPAALALLFAWWCGAFGAGAGWAAAACGWLALLLAGTVVGARWWDPWRLGRAGAFLPWALVVAVVLSWRFSPVTRAGTVGVVLLPAFVWLPAALARAWSSEAARRWGARAVALAVAGVAAPALALWLAGETPRPSLPVGQHLHLGVWLVLLLPLALLPWRERGVWRLVAAGAAALAAAAVLAARTLTGGLAVAAEAALALAWIATARRTSAERRRTAWRAAIMGAVLVAAALALSGRDLAAIARGTDPSFAARTVYWRAGGSGLLARPLLGFGPGATAWTLAEFLRPVPGVNPPSEVVGDLHMLPLGIAYELGFPGLLLAAAAGGLFAWRRLRERATASDPAFLAAGLLGLAGGAAAGLGTADLRVTALPVAAAVATAAALAGGRAQRSGGGASADGERSRRAGALVAGAYAVVAVLVLAPLARAQRQYEEAVDAPREKALAHLERAVELDSGFPLYSARLAWLEAEGSAGAGAERSLEAARTALGVAPLWLAAGAAAEAEGDSAEAALAYERACALDPLGALPPFRLLALGSPLHRPGAVAARSLAADPRLAAATWWRGREPLRERAVAHLAASVGIDEGWRAALAEVVDALPGDGDGDFEGGAELALVIDPSPAESVSLHLFRRRPWPARLAPVPVGRAARGELSELPPAVTLPGTDPHLFPPTCTGAFVPQRLRKTLWKSR